MNRIQYILAASFIGLSLSITACGGGSGSSGSSISPDVYTDITSGDDQSDVITVPEDVIVDVVKEDKDEFSDVQDVLNFSIKLTDSEGNPVDNALILIADENGNELAGAFTNSDGLADFPVTLDFGSGTISVTVKHSEFADRVLYIEDPSSLALVIREITLEDAVESAVLTDTDGDGIADELDAFPEDPSVASAVVRSYTVAFENGFAEVPDHDYNDLVAGIEITEYINSDNEVTKIRIKGKVLAGGTSDRNSFGIRLNGKDFIIVADVKELLSNWNTGLNESFKQSRTTNSFITFDSPVKKSVLGQAPFEPFMIVNGNSLKIVRMNDSVNSYGVSNVIAVPETWQWPYEGTDIWKAYPDFGKKSEWYKNPDAAYIYKRN
jgi:hypothetical protein